MKTLDNFIQEKLKINSKSKINKNEPLEADEIEGPETPGKDYFNEDVVIIGWPFKDKNDPNYKKTKEYIKKWGYSVYNDLEDIEDKDMWDYFCYAQPPNDGFEISDSEINCYVYGPEGVIGYNEK